MPPTLRNYPSISMSTLEPDFNPRAFLAFAEKLLHTTQDNPAVLRTVISRSYYAAFLFTRRRLGMGKRARHTEVWDALASRGGVKCWKTAGDGRNLCRQRNEADYGDRIGGLFEEAKKGH